MESITELLRTSVVNMELFDGISGKSSSANAMHIVFGVDKNYGRGMGVAMTSLLSSNPASDVVFHVFTDAIYEKDRERLSRLSGNSGVRINLYYINKHIFEDLPLSGHYSIAMFYRLIAPSILGGTVERFLYLDADIICLGNINELVGLNLHGNIAAVVSDCDEFAAKRSSELGLLNGKYFNSGFMYVDVERWNSEGISARAIKLLKEGRIRYWWGDQDVLNIELDGKVLFLQKKWNQMYDMIAMTEAISEDTLILHYTAAMKPWQAICRHPIRKYFFQYADVSLWGDDPLELPRDYDNIKKYALMLASEKRFIASSWWYGRRILMWLHFRAVRTYVKLKFWLPSCRD